MEDGVREKGIGVIDGESIGGSGAHLAAAGRDGCIGYFGGTVVDCDCIRVL